jgi:hypothetical protein
LEIIEAILSFLPFIISNLRMCQLRNDLAIMGLISREKRKLPPNKMEEAVDDLFFYRKKIQGQLAYFSRIIFFV